MLMYKEMELSKNDENPGFFQNWYLKTWKWEAEFQVSKTRIPGFQNSGPNPTWYLIYQVSKTGGLNLEKII